MGLVVNILAVGAHPDDLEQLCGGTLIQYARAGHIVTSCHATLGDRGSFTHTSEEIAALRCQFVWLKDHDGVDIVDQTRVMGAFRGYQCGVRYAEGFRSAMTWLRAAPRRLLP
jgi:hypothetical protein